MADIFNEIPEFNHQEKNVQIDPTEFIKVLESRRSIRVFENEKVPDEVVEKCLDLALKAPNSSNLQPWEFYFIKSDSMKEKVVKACLSQPAAKTAPVLIVCVAKINTWKRNTKLMLELFDKEEYIPSSALQYYQKIVPFAYTQGFFGEVGLLKKAFLSIFGLFKIVPREPTSLSQLKIWAIKSTALACENLMLSFRAFGYDSCPMEGYDSKYLKKILKLDRGSIPVMVVSAGKRSSKGVYGPQIRFDKSLFIKKV